MSRAALRIGTCSWKYESWRGLVYSDAVGPNYLQEYARRYDCVEVDQWFWSLYGPQKVVLPNPKTVEDYAAAVPEGFRFAVRLPNALTLSHFPRARKTDALVPNPHFLSVDVLHAFLDRLAPLGDKLGPLMFQFGYLNKQDWSRILEPRDADLEALAVRLKDLEARRRNVWLMVNNHFEGSAPLTIDRIKARRST